MRYNRDSSHVRCRLIVLNKRTKFYSKHNPVFFERFLNSRQKTVWNFNCTVMQHFATWHELWWTSPVFPSQIHLLFNVEDQNPILIYLTILSSRMVWGLFYLFLSVLYGGQPVKPVLSFSSFNLKVSLIRYGHSQPIFSIITNSNLTWYTWKWAGWNWAKWKFKITYIMQMK